MITLYCNYNLFLIRRIVPPPPPTDMDRGVLLVIVVSSGGVFGLFLIFLCLHRVFGFNCVKNPVSKSESHDDVLRVEIDNMMSPCAKLSSEDRSPSLKSCKSWGDDEFTKLSIGEGNHSQLFQYPECHANTSGHYDWGLGVASCSQCHKAPILNRGCKTCNKRMCMPCFDAHKNKKLNAKEISQVILQLFATKGSVQLAREQWSAFCTCVKAPQQFEDGVKTEFIEADQIISLLDQHPIFAVNSNTVLNRIINQKKNRYQPPEKTMAMPACADEKMHDWGPGLASCYLCGSKTLNRGCRNCNKKLCLDCFKLHMQMAKLAGEALNGTLDEKAHEEVAVAAAYKAAHQAPETNKCKVRFPPNFAKSCPVAAPKKEQSKVVSGFDFISPENLKFLMHGGALYCCLCRSGSILTQAQLSMAAAFVNVSSFKDELKENSVPYVDPHSDASLKYIFLLNKGMYCMGSNVNPELLNPKIFSSVQFHNECQPGSGMKKTTVWSNVEEPNTFRLTKPVIPIFFQVTFQLRCSVIPEHLLEQLSILSDGIPVHHAILMERTKRIKSGSDSTLKLKSILLYHFLSDGGALVTNVTCAINKSVPLVAAKIVDNLSSMGCHEVYETAEKTRRYLVKISKQLPAKESCPDDS